ncbi:unnamed protein product, partial [Rangifer tarandus platyrhynchus]
ELSRVLIPYSPVLSTEEKLLSDDGLSRCQNEEGGRVFTMITLHGTLDFTVWLSLLIQSTYKFARVIQW